MLSFTQHFLGWSFSLFFNHSILCRVLYLSHFFCKEDVRKSSSLINTILKVIVRDCINLQLDNKVEEAVRIFIHPMTQLLASMTKPQHIHYCQNDSIIIIVKKITKEKVLMSTVIYVCLLFPSAM